MLSDIINDITLNIAIAIDELAMTFNPPAEIKAQHTENKHNVGMAKKKLADTRSKARSALYAQSVVHAAERLKLQEKQTFERETLKDQVDEQIDLAKAHVTETKSVAKDKMTAVKATIRSRFANASLELVNAAA